MLLRRYLLACCLCLLAVWSASAAAQGDAPRSLAEITLPGSGYIKFPRVAVSPEGVLIAANTGRLNANLYTRAADSDAFGLVERLGPAEGQPDYSTASVAVAPDGRVVYSWINQAQRSIFARVRTPGGQWGATRTITAGAPFPVSVAVAASNSELIAVWRNPDRPLVFSRSGDGGASWSTPVAVSAQAVANAPAIAADANGMIAVAYTQGVGDHLQIFAGIWNGRSFDVRQISSGWGDFADPGVAVLANGRAVVSYRGVDDSGSASGVFYAERAADGSWPRARLVAGKVIGPVSVAADAQGGMSLFWIGAAQGRSQAWFARLPRGGAWSAPAGAAVVGDGTSFNLHGAVATAADGTLYGHAASEYFVGNTTYGRAYRFLAAGPDVRMTADPLLDGGAAQTRADMLALTFHNLSGEPSQLRLRWDAPPTEADAWQPFAAASSVQAPPAGERCVEHTLYTLVRSGALLQTQPASDTITLDRAVQATLTPLGVESAPGYTNDPSALLQVDASADCSGLTLARSLAAAEPSPVSGASVTLAVPVEPSEGSHTLGVELTDALGNSRTLTTTIIYDDTPPTLAPGATLEIDPDPQATVLQNLRLAEARYGDTDGPQPWALAVAVARDIALADAEQAWRLYPLEPASVALASDGSLTLSARLSLADLLPRAQLTPGAYHYQVRVVDRAGNLSATAATGSITLAEVTYLRLALPMLRR